MFSELACPAYCLPDAGIDTSHAGLLTTISASAVLEHRLPYIKSKLAILRCDAKLSRYADVNWHYLKAQYA